VCVCCVSLPPHSLIVFSNDTATTEIYTLSLHDALPISASRSGHCRAARSRRSRAAAVRRPSTCGRGEQTASATVRRRSRRYRSRSEEHTSELQSRENLVCRLLLEKKKRKKTKKITRLQS